MFYTFEKVNDIVFAQGFDEKSQFKYERVNDVSRFTFNGKTPSRRLLRSLVKDCERLAE